MVPELFKPWEDFRRYYVKRPRALRDAEAVFVPGLRGLDWPGYGH